MNDNQQTFTVNQLAERWGTSTKSVYELLKSKRIRGFRIGTGQRAHWRIAIGELERYERARAA